MKRTRLVLSASMALALAISGSMAAGAAGGEKVGVGDSNEGSAPNLDVLLSSELLKLEAERIELDMVLAQVKSTAELEGYLSDVPLRASPLRFLSATARKSFLDSLVFTEQGLASFSYADLVGELTASEIYQILTIFGVQHEVRNLPDVRVITRADRLVMARPQDTDKHGWPDFLCDSPGTCVVAEYYICTSNC